MKKIILSILVLLTLTGCTSSNIEDETEAFITETQNIETQNTEESIIPETTISAIETYPEPIKPMVIPAETLTKAAKLEDLVLIKDYIPDIFIDLKYSTKDNFTKEIIYEDDNAMLRLGTIKKLIKVQDRLKKEGLSLLIWDAYRPTSAQDKLWKICPDPKYVSDPNNGYSNHSRGNTVDISLVTINGEKIEMPSNFDEFSSLADRNYNDISKEALKNISILETIMKDEGFIPYYNEWWHFTDNISYPIVKDQ